MSAHIEEVIGWAESRGCRNDWTVVARAEQAALRARVAALEAVAAASLALLAETDAAHRAELRGTPYDAGRFARAEERWHAARAAAGLP